MKTVPFPGPDNSSFCGSRVTLIGCPAPQAVASQLQYGSPVLLSSKSWPGCRDLRMLAIRNRKNCGTKQGTWKDQRLAQKDLFRQARNEVSGTKRFLFIRSPVIKSLDRSPRLPIIYILTKHCLVDSPQSPVNEWEAALCWLKTPTLFFSMAAPSWMKGWDNTSLGRAGGGVW